VACAGLQADRVAAMTADPAPERIIPFRGDYYTLLPEARDLVRGLIYPVPDPRFPFLGVHFTRRIDGEVWAGPNAVLAFAMEGYRRRDISVRDLAGVLAYRGFIRLALRYWRTGLAEFWRDLSKRAFVGELRRYLPKLRADQVTFGPSGVRAQGLAPGARPLRPRGGRCAWRGPGFSHRPRASRARPVVLGRRGWHLCRECPARPAPPRRRHRHSRPRCRRSGPDRQAARGALDRRQ